MRRGVFLLACAVLSGFGLAEHSEDAGRTADDLSTAKLQYVERLAEGYSELLIAIDAKIQASAQSGDMDAAEGLIAEKRKFIDDGITPEAGGLQEAVSRYLQIRQEATAQLKAAYQSAIDNAVRSLDIARAKRIRAEMSAWRARPPGAGADPGREGDDGRGTVVDPAYADLYRAKAQFAARRNAARGDVIRFLDRRIKAASETGNLKVVEAAAAEKANFAETGELPVSADCVEAAEAYAATMRDAKLALLQSYDEAIRSLVRVRRLQAARQVRAERDAFESGKEDAISFVLPPVARERGRRAADPIMAELDNERRRQRQTLERAKEELTEHIERRIQARAEAADLDEVEALIAARTEFEARGVHPKLETLAQAVKRYEVLVASANSRFRRAVNLAAKRYRHAGRLDEARLLVADEGGDTDGGPEGMRRGTAADKDPDPPQLLAGAQVEEEGVLVATSRPYKVQGKYHVAGDQKLVMEKGVELVCAPGSEIFIAGRLVVNGTAELPVLCHGAQHLPGYWKGLRFDHARGKLLHLRVADAEVGIRMNRTMITLTTCVVAGNGKGLEIGTYGSNSDATLMDCVVAWNRGDALAITGSTVKLERCTIAQNAGWAIMAVYYPDFRIFGSVIAGNRLGGIFGRLYKSRNVVVNGCAIAGNGDGEIVNSASGEWDARGNFWGARLTRLLEDPAAGDVSAVIRGNVRTDGYLQEMPEECGASIRSLRGKKLW